MKDIAFHIAKGEAADLKATSFLSSRGAGLALLGATLVALAAGLYLTSGADVEETAAPSAPGLVDQSPLVTARHLAGEAHTPAEQQEAAQALRVADHEVDQAFETALRSATVQTAPLKGQALAVSQKIAALEKKIAAEQQHLADLTKAQPNAADPDDAAQQIALAQAQLELDNDELGDLHQDLIRLGGDARAKIQQALDEHETAQKQTVVMPSTSSPRDIESPESLETLPGKIEAFIEIRQRDHELRFAITQATLAVADLTHLHEALESETESHTAQPGGVEAEGAAISTIENLHALSNQRKTLAEYDTRIHDDQQLATIYKEWDGIVTTRERSILHRILLSFAVILGLLLAAVLITGLIRHYFATRMEEKRRLGHLRIVVELVVQVFALGIILIVTFGPPTQMPAIIGLATAGVTIVMKDFIVAFIGWFPLMGKNGIRVGDWVEINGVSGEVIEIGMLRTVLLETGNWADAGHPTGRRVTFMNSFAIEGRFFNFSTTGQWLWDELRVTVPRGDTAYARIEEIRQLVTDATEPDAAVAEEEWRKATKDQVLKGFSAAPAIDLRPATDGIEVTVRYITRAQKRYEMRSTLYHDVIRLLHYESEPEVTEKGPSEKALSEKGTSEKIVASVS